MFSQDYNSCITLNLPDFPPTHWPKSDSESLLRLHPIPFVGKKDHCSLPFLASFSSPSCVVHFFVSKLHLPFLCVPSFPLSSIAPSSLFIPLCSNIPLFSLASCSLSLYSCFHPYFTCMLFSLVPFILFHHSPPLFYIPIISICFSIPLFLPCFIIALSIPYIALSFLLSPFFAPAPPSPSLHNLPAFSTPTIISRTISPSGQTISSLLPSPDPFVSPLPSSPSLLPSHPSPLSRSLCLPSPFPTPFPPPLSPFSPLTYYVYYRHYYRVNADDEF